MSDENLESPVFPPCPVPPNPSPPSHPSDSDDSDDSDDDDADSSNEDDGLGDDLDDDESDDDDSDDDDGSDNSDDDDGSDNSDDSEDSSDEDNTGAAIGGFDRTKSPSPVKVSRSKVKVEKEENVENVRTAKFRAGRAQRPCQNYTPFLPQLTLSHHPSSLHSSLAQGGSSRKNRTWTKEEDQALLKGYKKFGAGKWHKIREGEIQSRRQNSSC